MSVKVNREALLNSLQSVQAGLSQREIIEQSNCFIFLGGNVSTFNDEVCCRAKSPLDKKFTGAVKAKSFIDLLSKMVEDDVELEPGDGKLWVKGKNKRADLRLEKDILLAVGSVEEPSGWLSLPDDFADAVSIVGACASSDNSRFGLTCIHFAPKYLEALDNVQMVRYKIKTGITEDFLVRRDSLKQVTGLGMTEFALTEAWLHFRNAAGLMVSCRRYIDQDFPELTEILKASGTKTTLPKGLKEAVERAQIFSSEIKDDDKVQVDLKPGKLKVSGRGISGGYEQSSKINYAGKPMRFMVSPKILTEVVQKHNEVEICQRQKRPDGTMTPNCMAINSSNWKFVTCLSMVDDNEPTPPSVDEETETVAATEED